MEMWIYWRGWKNCISCTTLTFQFLAEFSLLFTQCWQITYFGLLSCPISHSSKDREATVWWSSRMYILYPFNPSLVSPAQQSPYCTTQHEGVVPLCDPTGWHNTGLEVDSKGAQHHFYHNIAIVALHTAAASSASPEQAGSVVQEQYNCSIYEFTGFLDIQKPSLPLDQGGGAACYLSEKYSGLLLTR